MTSSPPSATLMFVPWWTWSLPIAVVVAIAVVVVLTIAKDWRRQHNRHPDPGDGQQLRSRRSREARWDSFNATDKRSDRHWS